MPGANHPDLTSLLARVVRLEEELSRTKAELALAKAEITRKEHIIEGLRHRIFGASSEKLDPAQLQLMFDELVLGKPAPSPDQSGGETSAPEGVKPSAARTRRTKADRFPKNLKILIEEEIIPDAVAANPDDYEQIGEEYHDELDVVKPQIFWRRKVIKKFRHKHDRTLPPVMAPAPLPSIPGTLCAPALAAQIITDKYEDHLPHYRQSKRFRRRHEIDIGRQTLNAWTHATADFLKPIGRAVKSEVLQATELQIDETPIDYLSPGHGSTKEGRLWVYRDPVTGNCYFDWHAGRGAKYLLEFLGYDEQTNTIAFQGDIQCDGYVVYESVARRVDGVRLAGCLAHIRREYTGVGTMAPEVTIPVLLHIQRIYFIESRMRQSATRETAAPPACRELIRRSRSRPIADELHRFLLEYRSKHLPHGAIGEAITYTLNQWSKFLVCLEQGVLEIDNNLVENMIRPTKLGMKNWMFFGNLESGTNNALFYTLLANCHAHGLEPETYLAEVIKRLPHDATPAQAAELTPARIAAARRAAEKQEVA
jgi:transposase